MTKNLLLAFFIALSLILSGLLYLESRRHVIPLSGQSETEITHQYPFLSKRIFLEKQNDILINFTPLRQALRQYLEKQKTSIGVYFEYLPSGTSIGINEQMEVRLASLIKIPVVMAVYKQIEQGNMQKDQVLIVGESDINRDYGGLWKKGPGTKITVREAVELSLIASDNTATRTLVSALPEGGIDHVFDSLDIPKDKEGNLPVISPKNYSSILRSLYLSSYLTKADSNEILDLLTKTNFSDKIPAGVPEDIKVAHKIGVFESDNIYSDCGVVYVPNRPYLVCIMIKGTDQEAQKHMALVSKMIYGYISRVSE